MTAGTSVDNASFNIPGTLRDAVSGVTMTVNNDGSINAGLTGTITISSVTPLTGTFTDRSGTIASGGVAQTLAAANATRKRIMIENPPSATENLFFNFTSAATTSTTSSSSWVLVPGGSFDSDGGPVTTELISVIAATTGHLFIAKEM